MTTLTTRLRRCDICQVMWEGDDPCWTCGNHGELIKWVQPPSAQRDRPSDER